MQNPPRSASSRPPLDCLLIGYNDRLAAFHDLAARPPQSPERRIFSRDHVLTSAGRMAYMDVINHHYNQAARERGLPGDGYYHVGEVGSLAAMYLSSYVQRAGFTARFVDLFAPERENLARILAEEKPRAVAITTTFYEGPPPVTEICRFVRRHQPDAFITVGGPLVDNLRVDYPGPELEDHLREMDADVYVCERQGELTFARVLAARRDGRSMESIPNLYVRSGGGYSFTGAEPESNSLDESAIDWSLFADGELGPTVQMRTARSCAFICTFCDYPIRTGALSVASVDTVERELQTLHRRGVRRLVFIDDTFNVPVPRFRELCRMMIRNRFDFEWFSYFRCSSVRDEETFDLMKESGCRAVFLGIESGDQTVLKNMSKSATVDQYRWGIEQIKKRGIVTFASLIVGFPGETQQTIQNTIDFLNDAAPELYRVEPWYYIHRAPVHRDAERFSITGQGYEWQHSTMEIGEALDGGDAIFSGVRSSSWCPQFNFSFWAIPYLLGKGMTMEQVLEFHTRCGELVRLNALEDPAARVAAGAGQAEASLAELCSSLRMAPPRYRLPAA